MSRTLLKSAAAPGWSGSLSVGLLGVNVSIELGIASPKISDEGGHPSFAHEAPKALLGFV
jgi:hypothetical protein